MKAIDIDRLVNDFKVDKAEVAALLFPDNNYPAKALKRVEDGLAEFSVSQLVSLAKYLGVNASEILNNVWKSEKSEIGKLVHVRSSFRAELDTETMQSRIFKDGKQFTDVLIHNRSISVTDYIAELNKLTF